MGLRAGNAWGLWLGGWSSGKQLVADAEHDQQAGDDRGDLAEALSMKWRIDARHGRAAARRGKGSAPRATMVEMMKKPRFI